MLPLAATLLTVQFLVEILRDYEFCVLPWILVCVVARELGVQPGVWFTTATHPVERGVRGFACADRAVAGCINLPTLL